MGLGAGITLTCLRIFFNPKPTIMDHLNNQRKEGKQEHKMHRYQYRKLIIALETNSNLKTLFMNPM